MGSDKRTVTLASWCDAEKRVGFKSAQLVLRGDTPGGKRLDVVVDLSEPWMTGWIIRQCREIAEQRAKEWTEASRGE